MSEKIKRFQETHDEIMKCHSEEDYLKLIERYTGQTFSKRFKNIRPIVSLLGTKGELVMVQITHCDWCGMPLSDDYRTEDDAVRCIYFCSEECQAAFNVKYPRAVGAWPGVKLSLRGLFVRLKDYAPVQEKPK